MPDTPIRFYGCRGGHGYLSNFYRSPFRLPRLLGGRPAPGDPLGWSTVEHFYQAAKSSTVAEAETIRQASSPRLAKLLGRRVRLPEDWNDFRVDVMLRGVLEKFRQNPGLRKRLLATGDSPLIEAAPGDYFWGEGRDGTGENWLGRILIAVRGRLG